MRTHTAAHSRSAAGLVALASAATVAATHPPCEFTTLTSSAGQYSNPTFDEVWQCLEANPFNATVAEATIASLQAMVQSYSFVELMKDTGAPWSLNVDIPGQLAAIGNASYACDYDFHDALTRFFASLHDAHTAYSRPTCYAIDAIQPVILVPLYQNRLLLQVAGTVYKGVDLSVGRVPAVYLNNEVVAINGQPALNAVNDFANDIAYGTDWSARFNAVMRSAAFGFRDGSTYGLPRSPSVNYTVVDSAGALHTFSADWYWVAGPGRTLGNFSASCVAPPPVAPCHRRRLLADDGATEESGDSVEFIRPVRAVNPQIELDTRGQFLDIAIPAQSSDATTVNAAGIATTTTAGPDLASLRTPVLPASGTSVLVSNQLTNYGLYITYDDAVAAVKVRLTTFEPPAMVACTNGPVCPSASQQQQQGQCFSQQIQATIQHAVTDAFNALNQYGASTLVFDLTTNGGGFVALGEAMLLALSSYLRANPSLVTGNYDFHYSPVYDEVLTYLAATPQANDIEPEMTSYYSSATGQVIGRSNTSWYTEGRIMYQGVGPVKVSQPVSLYTPAQLLTFSSPPPITLNANNFVIVTDGLCGSMCAQFAKTLQQNNLARVVYLGGIPGAPGDIAAFAGGFVDTISAVSAGMSSLMAQGWTPTVDVPTPLLTTATFSFNFAARRSQTSPGQYLQFDPSIADVRTYGWGDTGTVAMTTLVDAAISAVLSQQLLLANGEFAPAAPGPSFSLLQKYQAATAGLAAVVGVWLLATIGAVAFYFIRARRARKQAAAGVTPPPANWGEGANTVAPAASAAIVGTSNGNGTAVAPAPATAAAARAPAGAIVTIVPGV